MGDSNLALTQRASRVVLAHEPLFRIGDVTIEPQTRQLERDGQRVTLEPRVMQVLVALARSEGKVLTRDELVESCWGGRIVGDDAVNRAIVQIRQLTSGVAAGSFSVETVARVGYRLVKADRREDRPSLGSRLAKRRAVIAGVAALGVVGGSGLLTRPWSDRRDPEPLALQHYRRALEIRGQASRLQTEQAVSYLREATRIDPEFADAWGALAWSYRGLLEFGPRPDAARIEALSRSAAARALEIDGHNADAEAALLLLKPIYRNWLEIETGCRRLLAKYPGHSITEYNLALTLSETGRWREAQPFFQAVTDREPFWPLPCRGFINALLAGNRTEEAEDVLEVALERWPKRIDFWIINLRYLLASGQTAEALQFADDPRNLPAENPPLVELERTLIKAMASGIAEDRQLALSRIWKAATAEPGLAQIFILATALLGDKSSAFQMSEGFFFGTGAWSHIKAQRPNTSWLSLQQASPIRTSASFEALVREIGLHRYWRQTDLRPDYWAG